MPQDLGSEINSIKARRKAKIKKCEEKGLCIIDAIIKNGDVCVENYTEEEIIEAFKRAKEDIKVIE